MMDLGLKRIADTEADVKEETATKHAKKGDKGGKGAKGSKAAVDDELAKLIKSTARLALGTARDTAALKACVVRTIVFERDKAAAIVDEIKKTTTQYSQTVKAMKAEEKADFSSPHVFVWHTLINTLSEKTKSKECEKHVHSLSEHLKHLKTRGEKLAQETFPADPQNHVIESVRDVIAEEVTLCRLHKCWNPTLMKLEMSAAVGSNAAQALSAVAYILAAEAKGKLKSGPQPKSDSERKVLASFKALE
eukprot:TRINITY_DN41408_c0_g1_i1.p2 TRINITY_DN41408_c0_g1~~TRINITY_DN41408_c0_g1_i1.p2  ORF type:complete len:249 (-),score=65.04 TRINITY_DN41408_c0_g1_i1:81-827(-)